MEPDRPTPADPDSRPIVGLVGPCCSGKSTLVRELRLRGYRARDIAQEHSFAPRMWQQIGRASLLIFLDVSFETAQRRRWMDWRPPDLAEQQRRLAHARAHCDLYVDTDPFTPAEIEARVLDFLRQRLPPPEATA